MIVGVVLATLVLWRWEWWRAQLPAAVRGSSPLLVGFLVGLGTVGGELPNSFLKRRLDIAPGARRRTPAGMALAVLDQGDLVLGSGWHFCRCGRCRCRWQRSPSPASPRSTQ
jgi:hypothetical protein